MGTELYIGKLMYDDPNIDHYGFFFQLLLDGNEIGSFLNPEYSPDQGDMLLGTEHLAEYMFRNEIMSYRILNGESVRDWSVGKIEKLDDKLLEEFERNTKRELKELVDGKLQIYIGKFKYTEDSSEPYKFFYHLLLKLSGKEERSLFPEFTGDFNQEMETILDNIASRMSKSNITNYQIINGGSLTDLEGATLEELETPLLERFESKLLEKLKI